MSINRADALTMVLQELLGATNEVEAAAVVSADGLPMASALPGHMEEDRVGAMTAAMLSLGERAAESLGRGKLQQVFVEGANGYVFLMSAGPAVMAAVTRKNAKIGLILYEMRRAAASVERVLATGGASQAPRQQQAPAPQGVQPAPRL